MNSLKNITVSLDYYLAPKVWIAACFSISAEQVDLRLQDCINEAFLYSTQNSPIYLFPVFKELAGNHNVEFSVRTNRPFSGHVWFYKALLWVSNYFVRVKGIEEYKKRMQVKYD